MWHNSRRGFNLIRSRANARNNKLKRLELAVIGTLIVLVSGFAIYGTYSVVTASKGKEVASNNIEENASVDIYSEKEVIEKAEESKKQNDNTDIEGNIEINQEEIVEPEQVVENMKITALGEIMMVGSNWTSNSYSLAFKEIAAYSEKSDYTVASLATNITSLADLSDTKSKYIANENIVNAFSALGIDGLNIATDHMLDFSRNVFDKTIQILKNNEIKVIGLENDIVYAEKNGIRVAIIGINNVVIGSARDYIDAGIYIYNLEKLRNSIVEARTKADTVIVMTHYGKENVNQVTDVMRWFAREIVKAGADIVLGGHSLGLYPVEEYDGKLIIYSLGYLMHDTSKEAGKKSAIFDIIVNVEGEIEEVTMIPTYIQNKNTVKLYKDINQNTCNKFLHDLKNSSELSNYTSTIEEQKLVIKLNK